MFETIRQFSERTGLTYWAIRKMLLENQLPYVKVGNRYMVNVEQAVSVLSAMSAKVGA